MIRFFDVVFSVLGIVFLSPLLVFVYIMIVMESKGGGFYTQERVGLNGIDFKLIKFRSMAVGSDSKCLLTVGMNDARITKSGQFIRRYKIDELPQLINVLKGEMSLVGPRPPLAEEVNQYEKSEKRRLLVKPGLTGLWQVSGRSELDWEDAVRLDLYYVENWSLTLDILIIIRTAAAVWRGEGAY
jgi:lipopolysaccharide/colanic/teichoic acid biosynthesis glycosyltransferase